MAIVTHEMGFAKEVSDRLLFVDGGKIIEDDKPEVVFEHPTHERAREFFSKYYHKQKEVIKILID